jgi:hypothetical protein
MGMKSSGGAALCLPAQGRGANHSTKRGGMAGAKDRSDCRDGGWPVYANIGYGDL